MYSLKYLIGKLMAIPVLPIMYWQSVRIKRNMPSLPEANDLTGVIGNGKKEIKLLSIGESSVAGVGVKSHYQSIVGFISKNLVELKGVKVRWNVLAKSGFTAKNVNDKLIPLLKDEAPDLIVIGLGANDTFQTNHPLLWADEIKKLIKNIRSKYPTAPIVFMNMPPVRDFIVMGSLLHFFLGNLVDFFSLELKKIVAQHKNVWFNDKQISLEEFRTIGGANYKITDFFSDGVHPSELTYRIWGEKMGRFISEVVLKKT